MRVHVEVDVPGAQAAQYVDAQSDDHHAGGDLEAAPKDEADITISGSGHVRLLARPASLRSKVSGSGRITQAAER